MSGRGERLVRVARAILGHAEALQRPDLSALIERDLSRPSRGINICFVGRINTGKSTLINALTEYDVLPVGPTACTNVLIRVMHADSERAVIHREGGDERVVAPRDVRMYGSRARNRDNIHAVEWIDIYANVPWLEEGATIVDTPGFDAADEDRVELIGVCLAEADVVVLTYGFPSALPGPLEMGFLAEAASKRCTLLIAQNEFADPDDSDGDGIRDHIVRAARDRGVAGFSVFRVDARSARGTAELREALLDLLSRNADERLARVSDSVADELCATLAEERRVIESERIDETAAISKLEAQLKLLRLSNTQARSRLVICSSQFARKFRMLGDELQINLDAIASSDVSDVRNTEGRVNHLLSGWTRAVAALELELRGAISQALVDSFGPSGLAVPLSLGDATERSAPTWRYEPPAALGRIRRFVLGKSGQRRPTELVAGVLAEEGRRLVLSLARELASIVPQCTQPVEAWLSFNVDPLISRIEGYVQIAGARALDARETRRNILEDRGARLHQLRQLRTELGELADGK